MLEKYCLENPKKYDNLCHCVYVPTEDCNLGCPYCSRSCQFKKDNYFYASVDDFQRLLNFLKAQEAPEYEFEFFGGEPSVHPGLKVFHDMVADQLNVNVITTLTNLAKPLKYWQHDWPEKTAFLCSYHHWAMKNKQDEWFEKLYYLAERGYVFCARFVVTEEDEYEIVEAFEKYKRDDLNIEIWELVVDGWKLETEWANKFAKRENVDYGPKAQYYFDLSDESEIVFKDGRKATDDDFYFHRDFTHMMCNCRFRILENGDVYYCWNKAEDPNVKPLLNAFIDEPRKIQRWHMCTYNHCFCQQDVAHPKYSLQYFMRNKDEIQTD